MTIHFNLSSPGAKESPVRISVTHNGKQYRKSAGLSVPTKNWKGEKCGNARLDSALRLIRVGLESELDELSDEKAILRALERVEDGRWNEEPRPAYKSARRPSFWEYFREWSDRANAANRQRRLAFRLVGELMGTDADWEDVDSAYYRTLIRKMNEREYSKNYQGAIVGKLKTVMSEGFKMKWHRNEEFREFSKPSNETDSVYLTAAELDRIWKLDLKDPLEAKCRDLLILGCYSGARWEDFSRLSSANVQGGELRYIQRKTGARVILPLSPRVREVLRRNGGAAPKMVDVVFNRTVKVVCQRARVNGSVEVRRSKGEGYEHAVVPKWKMVSSHTCRRTCCTLLMQQGATLDLVMQVSGHRSLHALQKYLRQSLGDATEQLARMPFFR